MADNEGKARENILRESEDPKDFTPIKGYNFDENLDYSKLIDSYMTTGFQATHLAKAIEIIKEMRKENCTIYLGYTSNLVTSGLRDVIRYLAKNKFIDCIVTTAGGVEEDFIKCGKPFMLGRFEEKGAMLRERGINRTGNIFVPNSRYCSFEDFMMPIFNKLLEEQKETGHVITPSQFVDRLGKEINDESSIYYWTHKNNIPVFCPAITDGSLGDMTYFFVHNNPEFKIDIAADIHKLNEFTMEAKKTGIIILGAGLVKHHICNSNMFRNGADYAVYINNAQEFDGSDAGARPDEAVSWGKILPEAKMIKVYGDATILFPIVVAKAFKEQK